ncbi:MAG: Hsp20 family protein [Arsenophonus sp. NC-CH8-MAG3]
MTGEKPLAVTPAYNLLQKDKKHYEMTVSIPGYAQDELDISVLNNHLIISSKPKIEETNIAEKKMVANGCIRVLEKVSFL